MKYECIRCDYATDKLFLFVQHLERKKLCDPIKGDISLDDLKEQYIKPKLLSCNNCDKLFKTPNGLTQHKKVCNVNTNIITPTNNLTIEFENMRRELSELNSIKKELAELKETSNKDITELRQMVISNGAGPSNSSSSMQQQNIIASSASVQNANTINNNNITININPIYEENKDYITKEFVIECLNDKTDGLVKLFEKLHSPRRPYGPPFASLTFLFLTLLSCLDNTCKFLKLKQSICSSIFLRLKL
jgi:hypothetical protein